MSLENQIIEWITGTDPEQVELFDQLTSLISSSGQRLSRAKLGHLTSGEHRPSQALVKLYCHRERVYDRKLNLENISPLYLLWSAMRLSAGETSLTLSRALTMPMSDHTGLDKRTFCLDLSQVSLLDLTRVKDLTLTQLSPALMCEVLELTGGALRAVKISRGALSLPLIHALGEANVKVELDGVRRLSVDELAAVSQYPKLLKALKEATAHIPALEEWEAWRRPQREAALGSLEGAQLKQALKLGARVATLAPQRINGAELRMIYCPRGEPLLRSFLMSETLVTHGLYSEVLGEPLSSLALCDVPKRFSWRGALDFCNQLSALQGLTPVYTLGPGGKNPVITIDLDADGYRLPLSAEWTYAAEARTDLLYPGSDVAGDVAQYGRQLTHSSYFKEVEEPVATRAPNHWGFFDLSGLLDELCYDYIGQNGRRTSDPMTDRKQGKARVTRGGSLYSNCLDCMIAKVNEATIDVDGARYGLRLVRTYPDA